MMNTDKKIKANEIVGAVLILMIALGLPIMLSSDLGVADYIIIYVVIRLVLAVARSIANKLKRLGLIR